MGDDEGRGVNARGWGVNGGVNCESVANQWFRIKTQRGLPPRLSRVPVSGIQIPSHLSSIKVNLVSCISKATNHPAAAVFSAAVLPSASRYLSVSQLFSGIALM